MSPSSTPPPDPAHTVVLNSRIPPTPPPLSPVPASVPASNCVTYPWEELPLKKCLIQVRGFNWSVRNLVKYCLTHPADSLSPRNCLVACVGLFACSNGAFWLRAYRTTWGRASGGATLTTIHLRARWGRGRCGNLSEDFCKISAKSPHNLRATDAITRILPTFHKW